MYELKGVIFFFSCFFLSLAFRSVTFLGGLNILKWLIESFFAAKKVTVDFWFV